MIAGFYQVYLSPHDDEHRLIRAAVIAGLATLNRLDTILFFAPALVHLGHRGPTGRVRALLLGALPLGLWLAFATIYYGFPFPNTAYTRLATDFPVGEYLIRGVGYLQTGIETEPLLLVGIVAAVAASALGWRRDPRPGLLMLGVLVYLAYVVRIGGDFMSGRFLAAPFVASGFQPAS